jgi:hypothetical protein
MKESHVRRKVTRERNGEVIDLRQSNAVFIRAHMRTKIAAYRTYKRFGRTNDAWAELRAALAWAAVLTTWRKEGVDC